MQLLCVFVLLANGAAAETGSVLILHTNDLHDHVRIDYDESGGLPYVSGYVRQQRALRNDILVLDAGDVMEKGDLVAHATQSKLTYRAMDRVGYDAVAPGNHDDVYDLQHLVDCAALAPSMAMLCMNLFKEDGDPWFPSSKIFDVDGVRVGVIGMMRPRDTLSLSLEESAEVIRAESIKLDETAHLVIVVCHVGPAECKDISSIAPAVDIFVSGHTHSVLRKPQRTDSGAIIVQAGSYAEYVGRLELSIDLDTEELVTVNGELVPMDADHAPLDETLLDWVINEENELVPNAGRPVTHTEDGLGMLAIARLGAASIREMGNADIGFCHAGQIIRAKFPTGPVDENAVFRTGQRAHALVSTELTGADIEAYLNGLKRTGWGQTTWSGFRAKRAGNTYETSLVPDQTYRVVMPLKEWDTRFVRFFEEHTNEAIGRFVSTPEAFTYTDAVSAYIRARNLADDSLLSHCVELAAAMALD